MYVFALNLPTRSNFLMHKYPETSSRLQIAFSSRTSESKICLKLSYTFAISCFTAVFISSTFPLFTEAKLKILQGMFPVVSCTSHHPKWKTLQKVHLCFIFVGKKALKHTHIQRFTKPAGAGNQRYIVLRFPPLFYEVRFIYVKSICFTDF